MAEAVALIFEAQTDDLLTADKRLNNLNKTGATTAKVQKDISTQMGKTRFAVQNAAFQFQDLAVQIEGGVSPARALSQQIPQLLGGFGAIGAVTGLIAGLGVSLAGPLVDSLFESINSTEALDNALKDLEDTIRITKDGTVQLSEEFEILAEQSRDVAEVQLRARLISATNAANAAFSVLASTLDDFDTTLGKNSRSIVTQRAAIKGLADEYGLSASQVKELADLTRTAVGTKSIKDAQNLRDRINDIAISAGIGNESFIKFADGVNKAASESEKLARIQEVLKGAIADVDSQIIVSGETTTEAIKKRFEEQQKEILAIEENERRLTMFYAAEEERRNKDREVAATRRARLDLAVNQTLLNQQLSFSQQLGGILQQNSNENSAAAKAGYAIAQGVQVAQAINNANLAYTQILASIPPGDITGAATAVTIARAETIRGLGLATAGLIAGNAVGTLAARAQGGPVSPGQAYRVGEFGAETFVPSSAGSIVPSSRAANDARPVEVVNNIRVIGMNNAEVTTTTTRQNDQKIIQDIIIRELSNPSSASRQGLQRTSNVVPRGNR